MYSSMSVVVGFNIFPKLAVRIGVIPPTLLVELYALILLYVVAKLFKDVCETGLVL